MQRVHQEVHFINGKFEMATVVKIAIYYTSFIRHHFVEFLEHDERSEECYKANKCDKMSYKTSVIQYFFYFAPILN
jgi:hypothetical protein